LDKTTLCCSETEHPTTSGGNEADQRGDQIEEAEISAAAEKEVEKAELAAYDAAITASKLDKTHPWVYSPDGTRHTKEEYEQMIKDKVAKKDHFKKRPVSLAATTPAMLAFQGLWAIERVPNYWDRGNVVDKIANRLYVCNNDPSTVIVEVVYESLSASAKAQYTRIEEVKYADKKKTNPVRWTEMKQQMSPDFRKVRAEMILRAPDCDEWRSQFEHKIDGGAEVMEAAEAPSSIRELATEQDHSGFDEVPGE
jgi:hypothetical protein